jgi:hypothetical protein
MKISSLARYAFGIAAGAALLAGCSAAGTQSALTGAPAAPAAKGGIHQLSPQVLKHIAMTRADHKVPPANRKPAPKAWMKHVPAGASLVYVSDDGYYPAIMDVFDYSSGSLVGQTGGIGYFLYNPCSDNAGNVYVPDFDTGYTYEIQHATTTVINSWYSNGEPIGCSVSRTGDLAITNFYDFSYYQGGIYVFPGGGPSGTDIEGPGYTWPAGYDKHGKLYVEANYTGTCSTPCVAELNGSSWQILTLSGGTQYFPAAAQSMGGKFVGFGDQECFGTSTSCIFNTKISGTTATVKHTFQFTDTCYNSNNDLVGWGNISKQPNGVQKKKPKGFVGANLWCGDAAEWGKPAGNPTRVFSGTGFAYGATAVQ